MLFIKNNKYNCLKRKLYNYTRRIKCKELLICLLILIIIIIIWHIISPKKFVHDFTHYNRSRRLQDYIQEIEHILTEPSSVRCRGSVPLIALVSSAPANHAQRTAIRLTWGATQPTYFFMGISPNNHASQLANNMNESQMYDDIILSGFIDSYDNLTLKTNAMFSWVSRRCPRAKYVIKVDDDVFVNTWMLQEQLQNYTSNSYELIGRKYHNATPIRDIYDKWYAPYSLYDGELFPEYLSGPSYIIRGDIVPMIYKASFSVPLINLEDVYYTYLIAKKELKLNLTHSQHIVANKPFFNDICFYWNCVTIHEQTPEEIFNLWHDLMLLSRSNRC